MWVNGSQMPVFPPDGCVEGWIHVDIHRVVRWVCGGPTTHLKLLADVIYSGPEGGVFSVGDMLEWAEKYTFWPALTAWCALMIRDSSSQAARGN